jgi:hypothetical protein
MKLFRTLGITVVVLALMGLASAQSWTPLNNQPGIAAGTILQLRDGRILVHDNDNSDWAILTPDTSGSYVNGTWSFGGSMAALGYGPLYYGSQVLLNGRQVVIEGGEYNFGSAVWTTMGAIGTVTPFSGPLSWTANAPPVGWTTIGDAQSVILADGRYLQANCCTTQSAFFTGPNTWSSNGNLVGVDNDEGAYTLLQNGKVLMVDAWSTACSSTGSSELLNPTTNTWSCGPATPTQLWDSSGHELGPAIAMYNGKVFQVGATNATAIYDPSSNTWSSGPTPSGGLTGYDAPASLEPNGKVLEMLGPPGFAAGCQFVEYDPIANTLSNTANPTDCPGDPSYIGHLMILPTGQIMFTDFGGFVEVYTPASGTVAGVRPTILVRSTNLNSGSTNNLLYGYQLNGLTQNNAYGDDYQGDTDFPLVRLKSVADGSVHYAFTHDDSTHSIAGGTFGFTKFDLPTLTPGLYDFVSVANGIESNKIRVTVH